MIERRRPHEANHERLLEMQILDALLRIEELLTPASDTAVEGEVADFIKNIEPTKTPFMKAMAAKAKGTRGKVERL